MKTIKKYRNVILRIIDIFVIAISYYMAEIIISEPFKITQDLNQTIVNTVVLAVIIYSTMLHIFKTYKNITSYRRVMIDDSKIYK